MDTTGANIPYKETMELEAFPDVGSRDFQKGLCSLEIIAWIIIRWVALVYLIKDCLDLFEDGWRPRIAKPMLELCSPEE